MPLLRPVLLRPVLLRPVLLRPDFVRPVLVLLAAGLLLVGTAPPVPAAPVPAPVGTSAGSVTPVAGYGWPLPGTPAVTRAFDPPATVYGPGHRGVDLAGAGGAAVPAEGTAVPAEGAAVPAEGAVVLAAGAGVVAFAGSVAGRPVVSVDHPDGVRTTYEPVQPVVAAGQVVARGSPLGVLLGGHAGCPVQACLHWGARVGDTYLDPLLLLTPPRVRLLPWA